MELIHLDDTVDWDSKSSSYTFIGEHHVEFDDVCTDINNILVKMLGIGRIIARFPVILTMDQIGTLPIDWEEMSTHYPITIELAERFGEHLNWITVMERFIGENHHSPIVISIPDAWYTILRISRRHVAADDIRHIVMSDSIFVQEPLIDIYADIINWHVLLRDRVLSAKCIDRNMESIIQDRRSVVFLCSYQELTEQFVAKWYRHLDWVTISKRSGVYGLSPAFVRTWIKLLNLDLIFKHQKLSTDIIDTYKNSIQSGRSVIPTYQKLSRENILANSKFYSMTVVFEMQDVDLNLIYNLSKKGVPILKYIDIIAERFKTVSFMDTTIILPYPKTPASALSQLPLSPPSLLPGQLHQSEVLVAPAPGQPPVIPEVAVEQAPFRDSIVILDQKPKHDIHDAVYLISKRRQFQHPLVDKIVRQLKQKLH